MNGEVAQHRILGSHDFKIRQLAYARGKIKSAKTKLQLKSAKKGLRYLEKLFKIKQQTLTK